MVDLKKSEPFTISSERRRVYLERRQDDLAALRKALVEDDFSKFAEIGHRLKGNARLFDFPTIEEVAIRMEIGATDRERTALAAIVDQFATLITELSSTLSSEAVPNKSESVE